MKQAAIWVAIVALGASTAALAANPARYVVDAVADRSRPPADIASDASRDPTDTLVLSGVRPGMVVAELFPGGGYYTRLLSDVVGPQGAVIGIENAGWKDAVKADRDMLANGSHPNVSLQEEPFGQFELDRKVDLFWITQNYHDLKVAEFGHVDTSEFNRRVYAALKPGGVYLIVDHQAASEIGDDRISVLHRIAKSQVVHEVTAAGFKLVGEGRFLHRNTDDHTKPIFDPSVQGRTDQYALKFEKAAGVRADAADRP